MDNGTMVEAFKFLSYCQLAKNSLVSKKFCDVIQSHRHKLALLNTSICMRSLDTADIKFFDKEIFSEAYNEWAIRNSYAKQVLLDDQVASTQSKQNVPNTYQLSAFAHNKDLSYPWADAIFALHARAVFNHDNWLLFQYFVCLLTDPFIYIRSLELTLQVDVVNLLAGATSLDRNRLQCGNLNFNLNGDAQKLLCWIKDHVVCKQIEICHYYRSNFDQELLDFFMSGAYCTSEIRITSYIISKVVVDLIQKFLDMKSCDEYKLVESIEGNGEDGDFDVLTESYVKFLMKNEVNEYSYGYDYGHTLHAFEFVNNDVGKKLKLTVTKWLYTRPYYLLTNDNL